MSDLIGLAEYQKRRAAVSRSLKGAVGIVFAGDGGNVLHDRFVPDWNFYYLTGIDDEPGAAVLFDPKHPDPRRRCVLFLQPRNPEMERWDGVREPINTALRKKTGFDSIFRTQALSMFVSAAVTREKRMACLHPFSGYTSAVSPDLAVFRKVSERVIGTSIEDQTELLKKMRAVKSTKEVKAIRTAISATAEGFDAVMKSLKPNMGEKDIQRALERGFEDAGSGGVAYNSIVGSGFNGTVLHYIANDGIARDGDLLVIDAGAHVSHYASDITRTFPVNGKFTAEQKKLYELVLKAQEASIKAVKPGAKMWQVDKAARDVIEDAGYGDAFIHGIGHQLGIEVHDVTPQGSLEPGMVVTIEPGVYLPDKKIGIRIEDDILVTKSGRENLSKTIPKTVAEIEKAMRRSR